MGKRRKRGEGEKIEGEWKGELRRERGEEGNGSEREEGKGQKGENEKVREVSIVSISDAVIKNMAHTGRSRATTY